MIFTIHTDNIENSALTNLGNALHDELVKRGHEVQMDYNCSNLRGVIIDLTFRDVHKIEKQKRFTRIDGIIVKTECLNQHSKEKAIFLLSFGMKYPLIACSPFQYKSIINLVNDVFSKKYKLGILENLHTINLGIEDSFKVRGMNDKNYFIVPFNRVNQFEKNIKLHSRITSEVKKLLPKTKHYLFYLQELSKNNLKYQRELEPYLLSECPAREEYINNCNKAGIFISTSNHESFGLYYLELLKSGCVGVFLKKSWVSQLLPNYPYLSDENGLIKMVKHVYDNYEEARDHIMNKTIPFIEKNYSFKQFVNGIEELAKKYYGGD